MMIFSLQKFYVDDDDIEKGERKLNYYAHRKLNNVNNKKNYNGL